jgi:hypothetical protein
VAAIGLDADWTGRFVGKRSVRGRVRDGQVVYQFLDAFLENDGKWMRCDADAIAPADALTQG